MMTRFSVTRLKTRPVAVVRLLQAHGEKKPRSASLFKGQERRVIQLAA
jgi:hypothetical protein